VDTKFPDLHRMVRQRIEAGELPCEPGTNRMWAGKGGGKRCSACDQPIPPADNEYEVVLDQDLTGSSGSLLFHRTCLDIWILECRRRTG
jgi:hypothetical protein